MSEQLSSYAIKCQCLHSPGMTDADHSPCIAEDGPQHLVPPHLAFSTEAVQAVVCQDTPDPHRTPADDGFTSHAAQAPVTVDDVYALADEDGAQEGHQGEELG